MANDPDDRLERYLDQVCRGIAGPRALRSHVRDELRGHLLEAVAEHREGGLADDEALARALADFGGPEQVRVELEATHGHRLLAVVIDKALQWKERTMKSKWLWASWSHLSLAATVLAAGLFIAMTMVFIVPKHQMILRDQLMADPTGAASEEEVMKWSISYLAGVENVMEQGVWWALAIAAAWGVFEWRAKGENKTFIRLSAMGTMALGLTVAAALTAGAVVLPLILLTPLNDLRAPEAQVRRQLQEVEAGVAAMEREMTEPEASRNWLALNGAVTRAQSAAQSMARTGAAGPGLMTLEEPDKAQEARARLTAIDECLKEARDAVMRRDADGLERAMGRFRAARRAVPGPATRPVE